ncbi:gas vesicle protein [Phormidium sp. FACHB-592]|uniref:Gas vesicle protein n=1 Tax=Stenomitos frigidus AS-A4 TaxID=2933935 RepID=A0ABV0KH62_9CYAN|nr:gas vesicle protein [Phormidium sp. FACHB-592]MBD2073886.1 gas vesicle protein [Phormidium sp. FACHB-592]
MTAAIPTRSYPNTPSSTKDSARSISTSTSGSTLADVLERVLDKGIVIAGDISVSVATTELLTIRIRLLIASVDKAREMGINWWENNPHFSAQSQNLIEANQQLMQRVESLETELRSLRPAPASQAVPTA